MEYSRCQTLVWGSWCEGWSHLDCNPMCNLIELILSQQQVEPCPSWSWCDSQRVWFLRTSCLKWLESDIFWRNVSLPFKPNGIWFLRISVERHISKYINWSRRGIVTLLSLYPQGIWYVPPQTDIYHTPTPATQLPRGLMFYIPARYII